MKNNFTWERFELQFIKRIVYSSQTRPNLRPKRDVNDLILLLPYIDRICPRPEEKFIRHYYQEIMDGFFANSTHLVSIMKAFVKINYQGAKLGSMDEMLVCLKSFRLTTTVLRLILSEFYRQGKQTQLEDDVSIFTYPKTIDLTNSIANELPLFDYQEAAVSSLKEHFIENNQRAGVLQMPTGSGKTRMAVRFLLQDMVSRGYQVVWLTHRAMLIEQTADSIYQAAPIIKLTNKDKDSFKMVCVSGQHSTVRALESDDDVMIFSVQSLCKNLPYLQAVLHDNVLIVVDEAHHTLAPSYRLIIETIQGLVPNVKLLGLTATPVRMTDTATNQLMSLFDYQIIAETPMSSLIAKGILATPYYHPINTNIDFDTTITLDEQNYIRKWGELSPALMEVVARTAERNELIIRTYMNRREEFGKTLIFALNATHCISLCEGLQKEAVRCDYIYCAHSGNAEKIARFKSGDLDVLVNINIMTEGSDVPEIQTVFLTRPTSSDVLLMQMIGRGMRGKGCGGTETVNIVDFHDIWGSFAAWLNPALTLPGDPPPIVDTTTVAGDKSELFPWAMFHDLFEGVKTSFAGTLFQNSILPTGWYDVLDEYCNDRKVLLFESQMDGYKQLWADRKTWEDDASFDGEAALNKYFGGFGWIPSARDLQDVIDYYRLDNKMLHLNLFTSRKEIDAGCVAARLKEANARLSEIDDEISRVYGENQIIIDSIYGDLDTYTERVNDFLRYPKGIPPFGMKIDELPFEFLTLDRTPVYDLKELAREVVEEMFDGVYSELPPISWTDRPYSTYFGVYTWPIDPANGSDSIRINCVLNSKDVPRETVKYVLYHELLHKENHTHNKAFRNLEHQYPDYTAHEKFLAFTFPKFDLKYAL